MIDAGSTGSRMHVYQWEPRMFKTLPPPVSYPTTKLEWTNRMEPGISSFITHPEVGPPACRLSKDEARDGVSTAAFIQWTQMYSPTLTHPLTPTGIEHGTCTVASYAGDLTMYPLLIPHAFQVPLDNED